MRTALYTLTLIGAANFAAADNIPMEIESGIATHLPYLEYDATPNDFLQNPYIGQVSGGGTRIMIESQILDQNLWQHLFEDGTYNIAVAGVGSSFNQTTNYAVGSYLYAQTGYLAGFALGGQLAVQTPQTPGNSGTYLGTSAGTSHPVELSQAYLEYDYDKMIVADLGRIALNSPWINSTDPSTSSFVTYQGAEVNLNLSNNLSLSAFAINQMGNSLGFQPYSMYNSEFGSPIATDGTTPGAIGLGAKYSPSATDTLNLWGYQMFNYIDMAYLDNKYTLNLSQKLILTFAAQAATEGGQGENLLNNPEYTVTPYGSVNSNILGGQLGIYYDIWALTLSYDGVFGSGSYGNGGFVSPYTYQLLSDPLYTTSQVIGMIETSSAGNSYKVAPSVSLFDRSLTITPQYAYYATSAAPAAQEFDLITQYLVPKVKGLSLEGAYSYLEAPNNREGFAANVNVFEVFIQYLY